jgi:hypothetical protein
MTTTMMKGEILRVTGQKEIQVLEGSIWITQERDGDDYIVTKGGSFRIGCPGVTVISALKAASLAIA